MSIVQYPCRPSHIWGTKIQPEVFLTKVFLTPPPRGHGRPRLRVMDVRAEMLVFPGFRGPDRSFCPRTSAGMSAWTSAGYPAQKLTLWAAFSFQSYWAWTLARVRRCPEPPCLGNCGGGGGGQERIVRFLVCLLSRNIL